MNFPAKSVQPSPSRGPSIYSNSCLLSCQPAVHCLFLCILRVVYGPVSRCWQIRFYEKILMLPPPLSTLFLSLSVSFAAGKRRLFNCLEEKIAVSTSLSPFPTSRLPISFEAKLQFGRKVIFQIRPCSNAQKKTCFSVFVSLPTTRAT